MSDTPRHKHPSRLPASLKETAEVYLRERAQGAEPDGLSRYLDKAPDIAPEPEDLLPRG